ncbi:Dual specificity phosphatase, catalytic domain [Dillenia turbinata]|uniref:Dual specificity phosphatase, catalytic domain n=1 Tax=Dillenia turbinata TaxID=194707 RepID=A0AAN8Z7Y1_9MAGN
MDDLEKEYREELGALMRAISITNIIKQDTVPSQIEEGLFLGSVGASRDVTGLKKLNITHILTLSCTLPPASPDDFTYKVIHVMDRGDTNISQYFDECIDFIDEAKRKGGGVLVHCFVGKSRSVTIVVAYLMKKRGMSLSQALDYVKSRRHQASPNYGFLKQLKEFEQSLRGEETQAKILTQSVKDLSMKTCQ